LFSIQAGIKKGRHMIYILSTQFSNPHLTVINYTKHSKNILFMVEVFNGIE
jgi:hypothetical protein